VGLEGELGCLVRGDSDIVVEPIPIPQWRVVRSMRFVEMDVEEEGLVLRTELVQPPLGGFIDEER
jgi:hypothetical protein